MCFSTFNHVLKKILVFKQKKSNKSYEFRRVVPVQNFVYIFIDYKYKNIKILLKLTKRSKYIIRALIRAQSF